MTETWTPQDEKRLIELQERKRRVHEARMLPLLEIITEEMPTVRSIHAQEVADWMVHSADRLRDLLQPFDSGVRPDVPGSAA